MSRRFGRNQRRRAREAQAQLTVELNKTSDALSLTTRLSIERGRRVAILEGEIQRAKAMLPSSSALFGPTAIADSGERRDRVYLGSAPPFSLDDLSSEAMQPPQMVTVPLDMLLTDVVRDSVARQLHARVQFAGVDLVYGISPEALDSMPIDQLRDRLSKELARQFSVGLLKALAARGGR
ncbi:hypothetical protein [Roseateles chitosanitabidus]|uniref:hypothetical protein n=1 Tax=Roseateles chitosanitabidus TaxID=65048 RepID=UPI000829A348|nr:hypothetical protein [Roseateles chitosanitabidus]